MPVFIFAGFINIKIKTGKQLPGPTCYWIGSFSCHKNLQTKTQPLGTSLVTSISWLASEKH